MRYTITEMAGITTSNNTVAVAVVVTRLRSGLEREADGLSEVDARDEGSEWWSAPPPARRSRFFAIGSVLVNLPSSQ